MKRYLSVVFIAFLIFNATNAQGLLAQTNPVFGEEFQNEPSD